jgi:hypothetical protein
MRFLVSLCFLSVAVTAFQVHPHRSGRLVVLSGTKEDSDLTFDRMEGYPQSVDFARAKECAEHFGECSVEEMDILRKSECNIALHLIRC